MNNISKFLVFLSILTLNSISGYPFAWRVPIPINAQPKANHASYPTQHNSAAIMGAGVIVNQRNQSTGSSGNNLEVFGTIVLVIFSYIFGTILFLVGLFLLFWICVGLYMGFSTCYDKLKEKIIEFKNCKNTCCGFCRRK